MAPIIFVTCIYNVNHSLVCTPSKLYSMFLEDWLKDFLMHLMSYWNWVHVKELHNTVLLGERIILHLSHLPVCWLWWHLDADTVGYENALIIPFQIYVSSRKTNFCKWNRHCLAGSGTEPTQSVYQQNCSALQKAQGDYLKIDCKLQADTPANSGAKLIICLLLPNNNLIFLLLMLNAKPVS